ncbi:hypothetical protein [Aquipuribacter hungaricus]|uniref:Colicin import membrane protein n=1 Tax=Aquipuribacter hungaricus TaxID=545624 RepID=A0ABV7WIY6_9MICO
MVEQSDGMDDVLDGTLRVALTAAGRLAEIAAREQEQSARAARGVSENEARQLQARLDAERSAARAQLAPVRQDDWWDKARTSDIARAWQTAATWQQVDPEAAAAVTVIRQQVQKRFDVDIDTITAADPRSVQTLLDEHGPAAPRRGQEAAQQAEAAILLATDDRSRAASTAAQPAAAVDGWDSLQRRVDLGHRVAQQADPEVAEARVVADTHQATPPAAATALTATRGGHVVQRPAPAAEVRLER